MDKFLPISTVQAFLENVRLKDDDEIDLAVVEAIAAGQYTDIESLLSTCKSNAQRKYHKDIEDWGKTFMMLSS